MFLLNRADKIFLCIATLIVAIFSYLLYDDSLLFSDNTESLHEKIGIIYQIENDVRLKPASAFAWRSAGKKVSVHDKDRIFTGERSEVTIQLTDGSMINLKENSLVTLTLKNGEMALDLKFGDFTGELSENSKLKVTAGKEEFNLQGEKSTTNEKTIVILNKSRSGQMDIKLEQGAASVKTKNQTKTLEINRSVPLEAKLEENPQPEVQSLVADKIVFRQLKAGDPLTFNWTSTKKVPQYKIEISRDPSFKELAWTGRSTTEKISSPFRAGDGEFFWRVKALTVSGQELNKSATQSFKVIRMDRPVLTSPSLEQSLTFEMKIDTEDADLKGSFKIAWTPVEDSKKYRYQIASDTQFQNLITDQWVEDVEALSPLLFTGQYFVKVRAEKDPERFSAWTETHSVKMIVNKEVRPPAPVLVKNKIQFNPATSETRTPSSELPVPNLSWQKPEGITQFKVQVAKSKNFSNSKVYTITSDQFDLKDYKPGTSYFRVFSMSPRGLASLPSEVGTISVSFLDPKIIPMKDLVINGSDKTLPAPASEMLVGWSAVPGAKQYLLELDKTESFENPKQFEVNNTTVPILLDKPGTFHVRVTALDLNGQALSRRSPLEKFNYIYRVPLSIPLLIEPYDKTTVFLQQDTDAFVWLEWKTIQDAKNYQLDISISPSFEKLTLSTQTKEPRYLIKGKLPPGKLYWRVRAISEKEELSSDWTGPREFSILIKGNETFQ